MVASMQLLEGAEYLPTFADNEPQGCKTMFLHPSAFSPCSLQLLASSLALTRHIKPHPSHQLGAKLLGSQACTAVCSLVRS
jgi:hypothetical protein